MTSADRHPGDVRGRCTRIILTTAAVGTFVGENGHVESSTSQPWRDLAARLTRRTAPPRVAALAALFDAGLALFLAYVGAHYASDSGDVFLRIGTFPARAELPSPESVGPAWLVACAALPLALRRRYPLAVLWIVLVAALWMRDQPPDVVFYACLISAIAVYSAAAYSSMRVAMLASMPFAAVVLVGLFQEASTPDLSDRYLAVLVVVPVLLAAYGFRTWIRRTGEVRLELSRLQDEQADALRRAVDVERARIARDLHDVVTHNVSMMVIQAGAARTVMDAAPDDARTALVAVEAGGRAALSELRHVMGLLAVATDNGPSDADELTPQPGLDRLGELIDRVRMAGLPVTLTVTGTAMPLPQGVDLAAYRVVQEALTNSLKHASGSSATVRVQHGADDLRVEISDTGGSPGPTTTTGACRGLLGLRARLAVYDGTLVAGPRLGGGFYVRATIPVEQP